MLRLRRVHIHKYRGVLPGEELRFGPEAVFVLGRNGAGKTTFLELLTRLVACDVSHFVKEGGAVDVEWEMVADMGFGLIDDQTLQLRYVQEPAEVPELVTVEGVGASPPTPTPTWRLQGLLTPSLTTSRSAPDSDHDRSPALGLDDGPQPAFQFVLSSDHTLRFDHPTAATKVKIEIHEGNNVASGPLIHTAWAIAKPQRTLHGETPSLFRFSGRILYFTRPLEFSSVARFDEALETFRSIVGGPGPHATISLAEARSTNQGAGARFIPVELLPIEFQSEPTRLTNQIYRPDSLPQGSRFLAPLFEAFGALDVELRPRLVEEDEEGGSLWRTFDIFVRWPGGLKQRHDHLSFGQKRMLAFLWYQAVYHEVPVFTDELTNGLHSAWARQITDLLAGRQAFHAVQNPLMLDMAGLGAEEEIPSRFVLCETEVSATGRRWRWRNPTAEEAHELHVAWDAGFEDLSKILINRGLW